MKHLVNVHTDFREMQTYPFSVFVIAQRMKKTVLFFWLLVSTNRLLVSWTHEHVFKTYSLGIYVHRGMAVFIFLVTIIFVLRI